MKLVVGLGNPGPKYETTRHNAGFLVADALAEKASGSWESNSRFQGQVAKGTLFGERCLFLKPMTYMNLSGRAVAAVMRFHKMTAEDLIVLHDDVDVPSGRVKAREGGGHGGHNGIRSIIDETGQRDFHRLKLGVGKPDEPKVDTSRWVLSPMSDEELESFREALLEDVLVRLRGIFEKSKK